MLRTPFLPALLCALGLACAIPARADPLFTVANVHVDASAASAQEARIAAIDAGRPAAWQTLYRRLTREQDWPRQPQLDQGTLQRIVTGYYVANERRSTTRYVADVTYSFSPDAVAHLLQAAGIPYTQAQARRILLVPMAPGYSPNSGWTAALASPRFAGSTVPFAVPAGNGPDTEALQALSFDAASWNDVAPVAARIHASEAVLALAVPSGQKLIVTLKRLGVGEMPMKTSVEVPILQGATSTYPSAADAAVAAIGDMWKAHAAVDYGQKGKLTADVRIASLSQWASLQNMLAAVPNVASVSVIAMNTREAMLSVTYLGTTDQLRDALSQAGIALTNAGGRWQLAGAAAPGTP